MRTAILVAIALALPATVTACGVSGGAPSQPNYASRTSKPAPVPSKSCAAQVADWSQNGTSVGYRAIKIAQGYLSTIFYNDGEQDAQAKQAASNLETLMPKILANEPPKCIRTDDYGDTGTNDWSHFINGVQGAIANVQAGNYSAANSQADNAGQGGLYQLSQDASNAGYNGPFPDGGNT